MPDPEPELEEILEMILATSPYNHIVPSKPLHPLPTVDQARAAIEAYIKKRELRARKEAVDHIKRTAFRVSVEEVGELVPAGFDGHQVYITHDGHLEKAEQELKDL